MNVIFTEIGYESQPKCWLSPGYTGSDETDVESQNLCYKALFSTIPSKSWIEGIFIWWWDNPTTYDEDGGMDDNGWTPKGKPAENTISTFYLYYANPELHSFFILIASLSIAGVIVVIIIIIVKIKKKGGKKEDEKKENN
ncbi:MAG: glycoside hydrolase family 113 [Promethearchaeota archaeon]